MTKMRYIVCEDMFGYRRMSGPHEPEHFRAWLCYLRHCDIPVLYVIAYVEKT